MLLKIIGRASITLLIGAPVLGLFLINTIKNLYWLMVVKTLIPMIIAPMLIFGICDEANLVLKLYDNFRTPEEDL